MPRFRPGAIRVFSAVCGCAFGLVTLVGAAALFVDPSLTPVGVVVAVVISASTLSLPIWATGLLYSLYEGSLGLTRQSEQILVAAAAVTVGLYLVGFAAVLSRTDPLRTIGDGVYVLATILLLFLSVTALLVGFRDHRTSG